jgi:hypothetical protein
MVGNQSAVLTALTGRLVSDRDVDSLVLFGSQVRNVQAVGAADRWSDVDLHVIVHSPKRFAAKDWSNIPGLNYLFRVVRPASGGVYKLTVIFEQGEADLVLLSIRQMRLVRFGMMLGIHRTAGRLSTPLNAMSTIMSGGYRFLKGESDWAKLYRRIVDEMPGVRVTNVEAIDMANAFLCDLLWVVQKLERGETVAAQRMLHRSLIETNVSLLHELRTRRGAPTFQQARRVETLSEPEELESVQANARLNVSELNFAAQKALEGLCFLMKQLGTGWSVPQSLKPMLRRPDDSMRGE